MMKIIALISILKTRSVSGLSSFLGPYYIRNIKKATFLSIIGTK
ncbi:hypothetical protein SAMN04488542_13623 [Fontibacillus panacisegetis]|uniref:Uncharacterized protein n=1 Tax=Fontibacillus panacisegetis TaxID=670482 RepID=A0A1G7TET3_9BACL|nr:hypothetical protein SAMN04488542_13623 [Fontibacillus panacisegetis]